MFSSQMFSFLVVDLDAFLNGAKSLEGSICIMPRDQKVFLRAVGLYVCANVHSNRTNTLLTVNDSLTEKARFIFGRCLQAAYPARCGPHQLLQLAKGTAMIKHPSNELGRNP